MMSQEIRVWDPLIRVFHWGLVLAFSIGYLTGDEENNLHIYSGYAVLGLIIFRVLWGLIGARYARFSDFVYTPKIVIQYLKDLLAKNPRHYVGHNPAAGWMVIVMLLTLFVVTLSGLKLYAIEEGAGPLASGPTALTIVGSAYADDNEGDKYSKNGNRRDEDGEKDEFWEEVHEVSSNFMVLLVLLHIAGVIISSRLHDEHLIKSMFTGRKISKT